MWQALPLAMARESPKTTKALSEREKEFRELVAEWRKRINAVIDAPLFKDGRIDRQGHDALRGEEAVARKRLADYLQAVQS